VKNKSFSACVTLNQVNQISDKLTKGLVLYTKDPPRY